MKLTSIIVDDENFNIELLQDLLENHFSDQIEVKTTSNNFYDAVSKINSYRPNVLFLDVKLDRGTAFDILEKIEPYNYIVVFITAYSDFVLEALKYNTAYYVLKPTTHQQVKEAISSVKETYQSQNYTNPTQINNIVRELGNLTNNKFLDLHTLSLEDNKVTHVRCNDIYFIKANGRNSEIVLSNKTIIKSTKSVKHFEDVLKNENFFRTHKSYLVNLANVKNVTKSGGFYCEFENGKFVPISKSNVPHLYFKLNLTA